MRTRASQPAPGALAGDPLAMAFSVHITEHAHRYFPEFGAAPVRVEWIEKQTRSASVFYLYRVILGVHTQEVLVKVLLPPSARVATVPRDARPRPVQCASNEARWQQEYRALTQIYAHFSAQADARFAAVRVLDCIPDHRAVVMPVLRQPALRAVLLGSKLLPLRYRSVDLEAVFRNSGAWLRVFHDMPGVGDAAFRHTRRSQFIGFIAELTDFLAHRLGDRSAWAATAARIGSMAETSLPEALPLGLFHGDYAMRNVLVGAGNQISIIDTWAAFRASIYEDLASFLVGLRKYGPHLLGFGSLERFSRTARYEQAFLTGYFGDQQIAYAPLALYEIQYMLDKWTAILATPKHRSGRYSGYARAANQLVTGQFFRREIERKLLSLEAASMSDKVERRTMSAFTDELAGVPHGCVVYSHPRGPRIDNGGSHAFRE